LGVWYQERNRVCYLGIEKGGERKKIICYEVGMKKRREEEREEATNKKRGGRGVLKSL